MMTPIELWQLLWGRGCDLPTQTGCAITNGGDIQLFDCPILTDDQRQSILDAGFEITEEYIGSFGRIYILHDTEGAA